MRGRRRPSVAAPSTRRSRPGSYVPPALPAVAPTSGPYDFLFDRGAFFSTGIRPNPTIKAAWDNCQPIDYAINVDLAENDAQIEVLIASIEEMEQYTGIDFRYRGVTSAGMNIDDQILLPESFNPRPPHKYLPPMAGGGDVDFVDRLLQRRGHARAGRRRDRRRWFASSGHRRQTVGPSRCAASL